jgi:hypothetical protein
MRHVSEFVGHLGYQYVGSLQDKELGISDLWTYYWFDNSDYRSWSGVELSISHEDGVIVVSTRSVIARSYYDLVHQNLTIRLLRRHFGGSFTTDEGPNRYLHPGAGPPEPAASGCHLAFQRFGSNLIKCLTYFQYRSFNFKRIRGMGHKRLAIIHEMDPYTLSNNILLPFLVSSLEDYFKSTFVALLQYSTRKDSVLRAGRLSSEALATISSGQISVERAYAETLSFQRISSACRHIRDVDPTIDLASVLRKPYRRRKVSLLDSLESIANVRNRIVHEALVDVGLTDEKVASSIDDVAISIERCYRYLTRHRKWSFEKGWGAGSAASILKDLQKRVSEET